MIFYVLTILIIGLNGKPFPFSFFDPSNLAFSTLGLPKSINQEYHYFAIHDRL